MAKKGLSAKYRKFALAYAASATGVEAARAAGFKGTPASLAVTACRLLRNPDVRAVIDEIDSDTIERFTLTRDERLEALSAIAVDVEERTRDRLKALDQLCRAFGDYTEKLEVKVSGSFSEQLKKARQRAQRR